MENSPYLGNRDGLEFFGAPVPDFDEETLSKKNYQIIGLRALAIEAVISDQDLGVLAQAAASESLAFYSSILCTLRSTDIIG